jgi:hypothetical protein
VSGGELNSSFSSAAFTTASEAPQTMAASAFNLFVIIFFLNILDIESLP